jgi:hypothetical protein
MIAAPYQGDTKGFSQRLIHALRNTDWRMHPYAMDESLDERQAKVDTMQSGGYGLLTRRILDRIITGDLP